MSFSYSKLFWLSQKILDIENLLFYRIFHCLSSLTMQRIQIKMYNFYIYVMVNAVKIDLYVHTTCLVVFTS